MQSMSDERGAAVYEFLSGYQQQLCAVLAELEGADSFVRDPWTREGAANALAGRGLTAILEGGRLIERGGVALSGVTGSKLPPAATARNPQLAGRSFRAMGVSVVV